MIIARASGDTISVSAETFLEHILGDAQGWLVTFSGRQARIDRPEATANSLAKTTQRYFRHPAELNRAADHLRAESKRGRDAYFGTHLYRERGNRRSANAVGEVTTLWLDEDGGSFPESGPQPTAVVASSVERRHLYWRLSEPIPIAAAVSLNRRLAAFASGDIGKSGTSTVLRPPETKNFKRYPDVVDVHCVLTRAETLDPEVVDQALPVLPEPSRARSVEEPYDGPKMAIADYFEGIEVFTEVPDSLGSKFAIRCPWAEEHTGGDPTGTYCGQRRGGGPWFHCHHASCQGRSWVQFRQQTVLRAKVLALVSKGI